MLSLAIFGITRKALESVVVFDNNLWEWFRAIGSLFLVFLVSRIFHAFLVNRVEKLSKSTPGEWDDVFAEVIRKTGWYFHLAVSLVVASRFVELRHHLETAGRIYVVSAVAIQIGVWGQNAAAGITRVWMGVHGEAGHARTVAAGIRFIAKIAIWTLVAAVALSNLGVEVSAVVAGLGVGGVAAALAVQGILGDLFAGLSMYFDRPFDIGDFIVVDTVRGTVVRVGLRTTRLQSIDGEQVTLPNGDLVKSRIKNMSRLVERRIVVTIPLVHGTSPEKIERGREILAELISAREGLRLDRAHFRGVSAQSFDLEAVYFVETPDYRFFMDAQQAVHLELLRRFASEDIVLAAPTNQSSIASPGPLGATSAK